MSMKPELKNILKGRIAVMGVGNVMRGDDGFGSILAERLKDKTSAAVIDAGPAPENHVKAVRDSRPDTIILIDAADLGEKPGSAKLLTKNDIPVYGFSTHNASLALFFDFLEADTSAKVYMLAVQPERNNMNAPLSDTLKGRLQELETLFTELLPRQCR